MTAETFMQAKGYWDKVVICNRLLSMLSKEREMIVISRTSGVGDICLSKTDFETIIECLKKMVELNKMEAKSRLEEM